MFVGSNGGAFCYWGHNPEEYCEASFSGYHTVRVTCSFFPHILPHPRLKHNGTD